MPDMSRHMVDHAEFARRASRVIADKVATGCSMVAIAQRAGVRYSMVRRIRHAHARGDGLGSLPATDFCMVMRACGVGAEFIFMKGRRRAKRH